MISSGVIHGIGTSVPPQKRTSVETVTSRPSRTAARVGRRIARSCRPVETAESESGRLEGVRAARPNTIRRDAARRSEGDDPWRAPGCARAGGGRAARGRGLRGGRRARRRRGRGLSGRGLRAGGRDAGGKRVRRRRGREGAEAVGRGGRGAAGWV